jgi:tRNA (Thr-GGU) A37 N-methylase
MPAVKLEPIGRSGQGTSSWSSPRVLVHGLEAVDGTPIVDVKPVLATDIEQR